MLIRFDPFRDLERSLTQFSGFRSMPFDAVRRDETLELTFDLPGVDVDSIDVTIDRNILTVKAERTIERSEHDEVIGRERHHGRFTRRIRLSDGLDTGRVDASYVDGVLTLTIPVAETARPRKVEVHTGPAKLEAKSA